MSGLGKLGEKLKKERESKGYSIREVSEQIHITPKYIEALEQEEYSIFPSETYVVGFLRTYSEFLGFDPEEIIREYKGLKVQTSDTPIEKLTEVTKPTFEIDTNLIYKIAIIVLLIFILGLITYKIISVFSNITKKNTTLSTDITPCLEREIKKININKGNPFISIIDFYQNIEFIVEETGKFSLCLVELNHNLVPKTIKLEIQFQEKTYNIQSFPGETIILSNVISDLLKFPTQIELSIKEIGTNNAQLEILFTKKLEVNQKPITVVLEILQDTYIEWIADGKNYRGIFLKQGDIRIIEADTRLDIKIGNGAGVKFHRGDLPPKIAGPPGKIVKLIFNKIPDPLDPTKFTINETIQIAN